MDRTFIKPVHPFPLLTQTHPHAVRTGKTAEPACTAPSVRADLVRNRRATHTPLCFSHIISEAEIFLSFVSLEPCQSTAKGGKMSSGGNYSHLHRGKDSQLFIPFVEFMACIVESMTSCTGSVTNTKHPEGFLLLQLRTHKSEGRNKHQDVFLVLKGNHCAMFLG